MSSLIRSRLTLSNLIALAALAAAVGMGTAYAGAKLAKNSVGAKQIKANAVDGSKVKDGSLTGGDINSSTLGTVPTAKDASHASNADTLGGRSAGDLSTASGFSESTSAIGSLGGGADVTASVSITTQHAGPVLASGSAQLIGNSVGAKGSCLIILDGTISGSYEANLDTVGASQVIAVNFARTLPAGPHTAHLACNAAVGNVGKDDAALNLWSLGG